MQIHVSPVAIVKNSRQVPADDYWGAVVSDIELAENIPTAAFDGITQFSHLEIIFYFNKALPEDIVFSGYPRGNTGYPLTGIFAQRKKDRPNNIGLCTVELLLHTGRCITVKYLDAIDGTPVLDIKPVFREFEPKTAIAQPEWSTDLMKNYWK
jgi:tRNA (adenine37-N6)-methyltransferase